MELLTERSGRVAAARKLTRRAGRDAAGAFLAEGRLAVSEALATAPDAVREVFATEAAAAAHHDLLAGTGVAVRLVTEKAAAGLSETVTPQGLVAVCALRDVPAEDVVTSPPPLSVALAELADPGHAGTDHPCARHDLGAPRPRGRAPLPRGRSRPGGPTRR